MSDEQQPKLPEKSQNPFDFPRQAERDSQRAVIVHPDGRTEDVEIRSEKMWSGVLPRPEDFAKFGEVLPTAPERLLRMAEMEQQHRIALESVIVPANYKAGLRGQWLGAGISVTALFLATFTAYVGAPWEISVALVGVPVLSVARSLVTAFKSSDE